MTKLFIGLHSDPIKKIRSVYPILKKIEEVTQVPWQAMAGIWYRESFSVHPPSRHGGPWQFDPVPSPGCLRGFLNRFTSLSTVEKEDILRKGVNDFYAGGVLAACFFRLKTKPVITPDCPDEVIKDAMYGYNGRKYGSADHSPYVMNGFDEAHYPMRLIGTIPDDKGGRKHVDIYDHRPGAFTVYKQLKALFPNDGSLNNGKNQKI
jgi:hypothetical protein